MTTTPTSGAADLRTAAQAVVDRWDTPLWKDVPATAEYIGRLRAALAAGQATAAQQSGAKLNYSVLYVYASQHGLDYNSLCVAVQEASAQPAAATQQAGEVRRAARAPADNKKKGPL